MKYGGYLEKSVSLLCIAAVIVTSVVILVSHYYWDFDDAFIVYRYVENITSGNGWSFNLSENHNASTSVLNTLVIALATVVSGDPRVSAHILGGVWIFAAGIIVFLLLKERYGVPFSSAAAVVTVLLLGNNQTWGLETNLFIALCLLFVLFEYKGYNTWYLLGFIFLARPDGALFLVGKIIVTAAREKKAPWKGVSQTCMVIAPWALFSLYKFDSIFPATLHSKMWQGSSGFWGEGWIYWSSLVQLASGMKWWIAALAPPAIVGVVLAARNRAPVLYLLWFVVLQQATYVFINVPWYHWYTATAVFSFFLFAMYGAGEALALIRDAVCKAAPRIEESGWLIAVNAGLAASLLAFSILSSKGMMTKVMVDPRIEAYSNLSLQINKNAPAGSVAAIEVGVVGYYTGREVVDLLGLTSRSGEFSSGKNNDLFFKLLPSVVVVHEYVSTREMAIVYDPRFTKYYKLGGTVNSPGYQKLLYFVRI